MRTAIYARACMLSQEYGGHSDEDGAPLGMPRVHDEPETLKAAQTEYLHLRYDRQYQSPCLCKAVRQRDAYF